MGELRYIEDAVTLQLDADRCTSCATCISVCPRGVFDVVDKTVGIVDKGACIECGACALNCTAQAVTVEPGVGCAQAIINGWLRGGEPSCDCG